MLSDKQLMQMALDALEEITRHFSFSRLGESRLADTTARGKAHEAAAALRARLAQPEPAECDGGQCGIGGYCKQCPKTQQEPTARDINKVILDSIHDSSEVVAPPKREWQGLTDEEREEAIGWSVEHIEAKLKAKNHD